jgi:cytoskeletal protein CcmA (bactofilin family)
VQSIRTREGLVWKKDDEVPARPPVAPATTTEASRAPASRTGHATIGPTISVRGEVSGNEDLLIQGQVDGSVTLDLHAVTVGGGGRVKANITGRIITIEGDVEGDLRAEEQIILRGSAKVQGDLKAPRVVLEDGAVFRGLVDMGTPREGAEKSRGDAKAAGAAAAAGGPSAGSKPETSTVKTPPGGGTRPVGTAHEASRPGAGT